MSIPTAAQRALYETFNNVTSTFEFENLSAQDKFGTASVPNTQSNNLYLSSVNTVNNKVSLSNANAAAATAAAVAAAASAAVATQKAALVIEAFDKTAVYSDIALLTNSLFTSISQGIAATPKDSYFNLISTNSREFVLLYRVDGTVSTTVTSLSVAPADPPLVLANPNGIFSDVTTVSEDNLVSTRVVTTNIGTVTTTVTTKLTATLVKTYPSALAFSQATENLDYQSTNTFYVSTEGNDFTNTGRSWKTALRTIEAALAKATAVAEAALVNNPEPPVQLIEWAPETAVYTKGHLDMPDNCVIKAVHRTVFLRPAPGYEERNVFRMGSGCFLEGVMFEGWRLDSLENPTEGFAVSFRPGAVITRVPYAHKIAARAWLPETERKWSKIPPPLDVENANPLVGRAGGVVLADGMVCSQYSIFPNIMTWGATPVLPNGIGYCAKNGALINAVNAVSIWAHKHFLAINGGQIILSACSTQFGDYSLVADGQRNILSPTRAYTSSTGVNTPPVFKTQAYVPASVNDTAFNANDSAVLNFIASLENKANIDAITSDMFQKLVLAGYTGNWEYDLVKLEAKTKSDAALLLQCLYWTLSNNILGKEHNEQPMLDFAEGMFDTLCKPAYIIVNKFSIEKEPTTSPYNNSAIVAIKQAVVQIRDYRTTIINKVWSDLQSYGYTAGWTTTDAPTSDKSYTLRDSGTLLTAIENTLTYSNEQYIADFIRGLYDSKGILAINYRKLSATIYAFRSIRASLLALDFVSTVPSIVKTINDLFDALISSLYSSLSSREATKIAKSITSRLTPNLANKTTVVDAVWQEVVDAGYGTDLIPEYSSLIQTYISNVYDAVDDAIFLETDQPLLTFIDDKLYLSSGARAFPESIIPALIYAFNSLKRNMLPSGTVQARIKDTTNLINDLISNTTGNSNKYAFLFCWNYIKNQLMANQTPVDTTTMFKNAVSVYMSKLEDNILNPRLTSEPSRITAIGHTWTAVMGGVVLTKVPPANNSATIQDSIIERNNGVVIASGQDDQGNALFVGGLEISADTGELGGPPFDQAVRRVATKTAISRSF